MAFDHGFIRTHETDLTGKKVGNIVQTDPDADEVYLQKIVIQDPEDESDAGVLRITDGRAQVDAEVTGTVTVTDGSGSLTVDGAVTANAGTNLNTSALLTEADFDTKTGGLTEAAPGTDTASSGLNGRLQRIAQRLTSLIALLPTALGAGGGLKIDGSGTALPVSGTVTATATNLDIRDLTSVSDSVSTQAVVTEATGTIDGAMDAITLDLNGQPAAVFSIVGTLEGQVRFEGKISDDADWTSVTVYSQYDFDYITFSNGDALLFNQGTFLDVAGYESVRIRCDVFTTGSSDVLLRTASATPIQRIAAFETIPVNATGTVSVNALPAGFNNIGDVDVATVPVDPFGENADAAVAAGAAGSISAKLRSISRDLVANIVLATGANIIGRVGIDQTTPGTTNQVSASGPGAAASPTVGNPVRIGGRASNAIPTDVGADGDTTEFWTNRNGAPIGAQAPHVGLNGDPWSLVHEAAQYTGTQTSTVLVAGGGSEKLVVTKVQIQVGGTTAGTLQLYFGTGAFARGTNRAIFDGEFAPSATLKPGVVMDGPFIAGTNGDDLMVTTSAAINPLTINVWYYVIV